MDNTDAGYLPKSSRKHRVRVWFGKDSEGLGHPYKWNGSCVCGWGCTSWSWDRRYDVVMSGQTYAEWCEEQGHRDTFPFGGAMPMALEHVEIAYRNHPEFLELLTATE